jgi:hypothetical protein
MEVGSKDQDAAVRAGAIGYAKCGERAGLRSRALPAGHFGEFVGRQREHD